MSSDQSAATASATACVSKPKESFDPGAKALLRLGAPMMISRAGLAAMAFVDAWMIGRYAPGDLAALALYEGTFGRFIDIAVAFIASSIVVYPMASSHGGDDHKQALWRRMCVLAVAIGVFIAGSAFALQHVIPSAGQTAHLTAKAGQLAIVFSLGAVPGLLAIATATFLETTDRANSVAFAVTLANALNALLNWLLMSGRAGEAFTGAIGSAVSTTCVRTVLAVVLVGIVLSRDGTRALGGGNLAEDIARRQMQTSGTAAMTALGMHSLGSLFTAMASRFGALGLASYAACWTINMPGMLLVLGLGDAIGLRAAQTQGHSLRKDLQFLFGVLTILSVLIAAGARPLGALYSSDPEIGDAISRLLPLSAVVLLLDGMSLAIVSGLRGLADIKWPMTVQTTTMVAAPFVAAGFAIGFEAGIKGMLFAIIATSGTKLALLLRRQSNILSTRASQGH